MVEFARIVDAGDSTRTEGATARWAKDCASGIADLITSDDVKRLAAGWTTSHLRRPGAEAVHHRLSGLLVDPGPAQVRASLQAIAELPGFALYRHDAWYTVLDSLPAAEASGRAVVDAVGQHRKSNPRHWPQRKPPHDIPTYLDQGPRIRPCHYPRRRQTRAHQSLRCPHPRAKDANSHQCCP